MQFVIHKEGLAIEACCKFFFKLLNWLKVLLCSLKEKKNENMLIWRKWKIGENNEFGK